MSRAAAEMRRALRDDGARASTGKSSFSLPPALRTMVDVLRPQEAEQPILPPAVRQAVHGWMTEIRAADELAAVKVKPRTSAMLSGPPGCGKTTLAHHLAARLGLPLVCIHMDRLKSKWVGATGENIANIFEALSEQADACVTFMDEFDAVAMTRTSDTQSAARESNAVVDALLARVERFQGIMIAATNRADAIDPAMWRRFGLQLEIPLPTDDERFAIMARYLEPFALPEAALEFLTDVTAGASPALLRQLMEGVKRDLVLAPKLSHETDARAVFLRVMASTKPHKDYSTPPLWCEAAVKAQLDSMAWPPTLTTRGPAKPDKPEKPA